MTYPKIVNCYHKESFSGIGDFFRGSIYLYERCKKNGIDFSLSLNNHPISKHLKFKTQEDCSVDLITDIPVNFSCSDKSLGLNKFCISELDKIFSTLNNMEGGRKLIFSNYHEVLEFDHLSIMNFINSLKLKKDVCSWFSNNIYFSKEIEDLAKNKLNFGDFNVLHFRLGDKYSFYQDSNDNFDIDYFLSIINRQEKKNTIILSDNNALKEAIIENKNKISIPVFVIHSESGHTQKNTGIDLLDFNEDSYFFSVLDLKILSLASKVTGYSSYYWGTGFSSWICKLLSIPFSCKPFMKGNKIYNFN